MQPHRHPYQWFLGALGALIFSVFYTFPAKATENNISIPALTSADEAESALSEIYLPPPATPLLEKIKEAQEDLSAHIVVFQDTLRILEKFRADLKKLEGKPQAKKTKTDLLLEKNLREKIIPALDITRRYRAEKTSISVLNKATGDIIEIQFQEKLEKTSEPKKHRGSPETSGSPKIRGFPTYTGNCTVIQHGGNGHGMNLLARCNDSRGGEYIMPVLALAHFHLRESPATKGVLHFYTPYSPSIHEKELVDAGRIYLATAINQAFTRLRERRVASKAYLGSLVHEKYSPGFIEALIINEHTDHAEFNEASAAATSGKSDIPHAHPIKLLIEKVFVVLGANKERSYIFSMSENRDPQLRAYGLAQFIPRTYSNMRKAYPDAGLARDFYEGMRDHVNAIEAMVLLFDRDLASFSQKAREVCMTSAELLEDCLAVAYNGGVGRLNAVIQTHGKEWDEQKSVPRGRRLLKRGLTHETNTYIEKLRAIRAIQKEERLAGMKKKS